jgi:hypothetical protein
LVAESACVTAAALRHDLQLQEAKERAACLEAHRGRLEAAAALAHAEGAYLAAERQLVLAQLRRLSLLLASQVRAADADPNADNDAAAGAAEAARAEAKAAEAAAVGAWCALPRESGLRALGGPPERLREVRALGRGLGRLLAAHRREVLDCEQRADTAEAQLEASEGRCRQLVGRLRAVAKAAGAHAAEAEARAVEAAQERDAAQEREAWLQARLEAVVRAAREVGHGVGLSICSKRRVVLRFATAGGNLGSLLLVAAVACDSHTKARQTRS